MTLRGPQKGPDGSADGATRKKAKAGKSADGTMSLMEHLHELRRRLFFAVLGVLAGTIVGFYWFGVDIPGLRNSSLGHLLLEPYCAVPSPPRQTLDGECKLLATGVFSPLQIRLKSAMMAGALLSCPVWLTQLWGFVTPALYAKEKRYARIFVGCAALLMVAGAALAYLVIPEGLKVLLGFGSNFTTSALDPDRYYSFLISVMLIFGVSFLLPLLLVMLNFVGAVSGARLAKARRYSMFGLVVFAGLVVPGNDPITMLALAVALCLLYELAVQVAKVHDKRKAKRLAAEGFGDISDDEASPLPITSRPQGDPGAAPVSEPLTPAETIAGQPPQPAPPQPTSPQPAPPQQTQPAAAAPAPDGPSAATPDRPRFDPDAT